MRSLIWTGLSTLYIYIHLHIVSFYKLERISKLFCCKKTVLQRETLAILLCECGPWTKNINNISQNKNTLYKLLFSNFCVNVMMATVDVRKPHKKSLIHPPVMFKHGTVTIIRKSQTVCINQSKNVYVHITLKFYFFLCYRPGYNSTFNNR